MIEKLREYEPDAKVLVRMTVGDGPAEDVYTDPAEHVYRSRAGAVIVDGGL